MTDADREALVERMASVIARADGNDWQALESTYNGRQAKAVYRKQAFAALSVAEPVVREDEREACIAATRKALAAYGRWQGAITPDTLLSKIVPAIRASAVEER